VVEELVVGIGYNVPVIGFIQYDAPALLNKRIAHGGINHAVLKKHEVIIVFMPHSLNHCAL
jgi:hypothetical protein